MVDYVMMLTLDSLTTPLHITGCVGKQRQEPSIKLSYQKQGNGLGRKLINNPQYYPTLVYSLSRNAYHGGSHQISLIPIGQSQVPGKKSAKTSTSKVQLLDCNKPRGQTDSTEDNANMCLRKHSSEYVRNDAKRNYSFNNVIKQRKIECVDNNISATSTADVKKEVSFISIINKDGNFPKKPWHAANFDLNQNTIITNSSCNRYTGGNQKETEPTKDLPNESLEKQECSNIDDTSTRQISLNKSKISLCKPSSHISLSGKSPTMPLMKAPTSKLCNSTCEQNMHSTYSTIVERLRRHSQTQSNAIETEQKNKKILQVSSPNHEKALCRNTIKSKLGQNSSNESRHPEIRSDKQKKVSFHAFRQRLYKRIDHNCDINEKMKVGFVKTSMPSKMESSSFKKQNNTSAVLERSSATSMEANLEAEKCPFNPMYTTQISIYNPTDADENGEKDTHNGLLSLNSKNLTLLEILSSKNGSKVHSKHKRIYTWLEDCRRYARENLFLELDAKIKNG